jgi:hypothetical protein
VGKASIWAQWSIIIAGVLLSPLIVLFTAGVLDWSVVSQTAARRV